MPRPDRVRHGGQGTLHRGNRSGEVAAGETMFRRAILEGAWQLEPEAGCRRRRRQLEVVPGSRTLSPCRRCDREAALALPRNADEPDTVLDVVRAPDQDLLPRIVVEHGPDVRGQVGQVREAATQRCPPLLPGASRGPAYGCFPQPILVVVRRDDEEHSLQSHGLRHVLDLPRHAF